ncbi:hypothetical protein ACI65C_013522 [Semiaphis heraclei]
MSRNDCGPLLCRSSSRRWKRSLSIGLTTYIRANVSWMNNIQTDDADGAFVYYNDLNMERKKEPLLTLRQENGQLLKKLNILNEAIDVLKDNNSEEKITYYDKVDFNK